MFCTSQEIYCEDHLRNVKTYSTPVLNNYCSLQRVVVVMLTRSSCCLELTLLTVQPDGMKQRVEEGRHSGLFSFIRRNSLGDKKSLPNAASNVPPTTAPSDSAADSRQNNDGISFLP